MSDVGPKKQIDARLVVDLRPRRAPPARPRREAIPAPPWANEDAWCGYSGVHEAGWSSGPTNDVVLAPTLVAQHEALLDALAETQPALHEALRSTGGAFAEMQRLADESGDPGVLAIATIFNATWLATVARGDGAPELLDRLAASAQEHLRAAAPQSKQVAPPSLRALAEELILCLSLYVAHGVIVAETADSGHRDHRDRFIVIARIGIVIAESERSDVFGWLGRSGWSSSRSEATFSSSVSPTASCA